MAKKIITEAQIKAIITKVLKEQFENNAFTRLEQQINDKRADAENEIEVLQNQLRQLEQVIPTFQAVDKQIKERFPDIQGPQADNYGTSFMYTFSTPINYDEENDTYGDTDEIEDEIKEYFPEDIRHAISVHTQDDINNNYTREGFEISIDLDELGGWY